ncbi:MAG: ABC transporter permease [Sporolactobacillus sp.]
MVTIRNAYYYIQNNPNLFGQALGIHLALSALALLIGLCISVPLGILSAKNERLSGLIMSSINGLRVVPSLAILAIIMPILGTGFFPSLIALTILACPPILINTFLGIRKVDRQVIEAAFGMGMDSRMVLRRIEIPQAVPLMLTGIRTAAVEVISSATLAAFIGGGGLGTFIINGLGMYDFSLLLVGAVPVALLAICSELIFGAIERWVTKYNRI